jgi:hypothetical protein
MTTNWRAWLQSRLLAAISQLFIGLLLAGTSENAPAMFRSADWLV